MLRRFKNGLAVLLALLVFGVSSQGAVCEVTCVSAVQPSCCQGAAAGGSAAMVMPDSHCAGDAIAAPDMSAHLESQSVCTHFMVLAVERNASAGVPFADVQWSVVAVLPVRVEMSGRERAASKSPPLRLAWTDPLLVSLRV